jgi:hypothetical protein
MAFRRLWAFLLCACLCCSPSCQINSTHVGIDSEELREDAQSISPLAPPGNAAPLALKQSREPPPAAFSSSEISPSRDLQLDGRQSRACGGPKCNFSDAFSLRDALLPTHMSGLEPHEGSAPPRPEPVALLGESSTAPNVSVSNPDCATAPKEAAADAALDLTPPPAPPPPPKEDRHNFASAKDGAKVGPDAACHNGVPPVSDGTC